MDREEYLKNYGIEETSRIDSPPQTTSEIAKKREELELKKLEIEIEKLEKPSTSIDYFQKMLELQQQNFTQQMELIKQQGNLQLEIEKLKLGDEADNTLEWIKTLSPIISHLPQLQNGKLTGGISFSPSELNEGGEVKQNSDMNSDLITFREIGDLFDEYAEQIKEGKTDLETAWKEFQESSFSKLLSKPQFEIVFEKLRQGKL